MSPGLKLDSAAAGGVEGRCLVGDRAHGGGAGGWGREGCGVGCAGETMGLGWGALRGGVGSCRGGVGVAGGRRGGGWSTDHTRI